MNVKGVGAMDIESVRDLKTRIRQDRVSAYAREDHNRRSLGVRTQAVRDINFPNSIALGVARHPDGGREHVLAVRVQHPLLWNSPEVEAICEEAKHEVDLRFVGHIRPLQTSRQTRSQTMSQTGLQARLQTECRPLQIGCSIGQYQITAGSLGGFVRDRTTGTILLLSNNHVLANENLAIEGDPVLQPGFFDHGIEGKDTVAYLRRFIPLDWANLNYVDCATASVSRIDWIDPRTLDSRGTLKGGRTAPLAGPEAVYKIGRTTGLTTGTVTAVEVDNITISYDQGTAVFDGQIEVQGGDNIPFAVGGDSGSLVFDQNNQALGMVFGGTLQGWDTNIGLTYVNPLNRVLNELNVDLLY
ncbi:MAG TPA: hypothetical protein VGL00_05015 [Terracidiphilus sp.]